MRDADRMDHWDPRAGRMRIPRSRGAMSGMLLVLLGLWGALIPFIGPYINLAYDPDTPWMWTTARGWLEVLPGAVTVLGGLLLMMSRNRAMALFGGWLALVAGVWFVVGRLFASPLGLGDFGAPVANGQAGLMITELVFFTGVGSMIIALSGMALGRLSVRTLRDIRYGQPLDEYHRDDYARTADREEIAHERAVATSDERAHERVDERAEAGTAGPPRRHRDWRHPFGGARPVAH